MAAFVQGFTMLYNRLQGSMLFFQELGCFVNHNYVSTLHKTSHKISQFDLFDTQFFSLLLISSANESPWCY